MLPFLYGVSQSLFPFAASVQDDYSSPGLEFLLIELYFKKIPNYYFISNTSFVLTPLALPLHLVSSVNLISCLYIPHPWLDLEPRSCCRHAVVNLSSPAPSL